MPHPVETCALLSLGGAGTQRAASGASMSRCGGLRAEKTGGVDGLETEGKKGTAISIKPKLRGRKVAPARGLRATS